jgi:hypothetical protein
MPWSMALAIYALQRVSLAVSVTSMTLPVYIASKQGPSPWLYCVSSNCAAVASLLPTVRGRRGSPLTVIPQDNSGPMPAACSATWLRNSWRVLVDSTKSCSALMCSGDAASGSFVIGRIRLSGGARVPHGEPRIEDGTSHGQAHSRCLRLIPSEYPQPEGAVCPSTGCDAFVSRSPGRMLPNPVSCR